MAATTHLASAPGKLVKSAQKVNGAPARDQVIEP